MTQLSLKPVGHFPLASTGHRWSQRKWSQSSQGTGQWCPWEFVHRLLKRYWTGEEGSCSHFHRVWWYTEPDTEAGTRSKGLSNLRQYEPTHLSHWHGLHSLLILHSSLQPLLLKNPLCLIWEEHSIPIKHHPQLGVGSLHLLLEDECSWNPCGTERSDNAQFRMRTREAASMLWWGPRNIWALG